MSSFTSVTSIILLLNLLILSQAAPPSGHSQPCDIHLSMINCHGPSISDVSLLQLKEQLSTHYKGMYFSELIISSTDVTAIGPDVFGDVEFETIIISDNEHLRHIDETAFQATKSTHSLSIVNNLQLKSSITLYRLASRLEPTEVDFDSNSLEEVPSYAFNTSHTTSEYHQVKAFKKVQLRGNQIRQIKPNAFYLLNSVSEIYLDKNKVEHISRQAFNFANHIHDDPKEEVQVDLKIHLAHNSLTSTSFEADFIELNGNTSLVLDLSHNTIMELKESVFKPLMAKNVTLNLTGNKVTCHNTAWLFKEENTKLAHKTKGITC